MKLKHFLSLVVIMGSMTFKENLSAHETKFQIIHVSLPSPFNLLSVPLDWKLSGIKGNKNDDDNTHILTFKNIQNTNVYFEIAGSKPFEEDISLEAIEIRLKSDLQKDVKTTPQIDYKQFGKYEWLRLKTQETTKVTSVTETIEQLYFTIANNCIIIVGFTAPKDVFNDYLSLFEETINTIGQ